MKIKLLLIAAIFLGFLLRFYQLGKVPLSLYWDEASLGYNAFSISQTLHDEHGEYLPLGRFIAFGDYKAPGYIYVDAIFVKILGLSEFSTRFPSAVAGSLLILMAYGIAKELLKDDKIALLSAFVMAVSPWGIQFSRGAFEANLATFFSSLGFLCLIKAINGQKTIYYLISAVALVLSVYTFNSHRVFVPLFIIAITLILLKKIIPSWKKFLLFGVLFSILLLPQIPFLVAREGSLRFNEVTWLNDLEPINKANRYISEDGGGVIANLLHNRRIEFVSQFAKHYTDNFNWDFLFLHGDVNPRLSSRGVGVFYWPEAVFLLVGIYTLARNKKRGGLLILAWVILGLIPASVARETPHALRILNILPIPQIVIAVGIVSMVQRLRYVKYALVITYCLVLVSCSHYYFLHYSRDYATEWQYGYKQLVNYVNSVENNYDYISVNNFYGRPYIYFLFYKQYDPNKYWVNKTDDRDWYGFWTVKSFDKYYFGSGEIHTGHGLVVQQPGVTVNQKLIKIITDPLGKAVFEIYET